MTGFEFLENISSIDDDLIFEAENWVDHKPRNLKILAGIAAAAAACLCFTAGLSVGSSHEKNDGFLVFGASGGSVDNSDNSSDVVNVDPGGEEILWGPCPTLPGADEIYPTIMVNGKLYEWKQGRAVIDEWDLPKGCVYRGKIYYMPGKTVPEANQEFVSAFNTSGLIFIDPEEDLVYLQITTSWLDRKFVIFEPVETSERYKYQQEVKAREEAEKNNSSIG